MLLLVSSTLLFSDDDYEERRHYYHKDLSHLDLTHDQKKSIKKLLRQYRYELKEYREFKEDMVDEKEDIFEKDTFDKESIIKINLKLATEASKIETRFLENIHKILSKNQRELFIEHMDEWEIE
jgi:Spy/CpxP family protein refolding chaperone